MPHIVSSSGSIVDNKTVRHLPLADQIVVLGTDGAVVQQGTYESLSSHEGLVSTALDQPCQTNESPQMESNKLMVKKAVKGPSKEEEMDLTRKTGDFAIYAYYFRSIGWTLSLGMFGTQIALTFAWSFPGESNDPKQACNPY